MRGEFGGPRGWKVTRLNAETYKGDAEKPRGIGRRVACELAKRVGFLFAAGASDLVSMARSLAAIGSSAPDQDPLRGARPDESRCQIGTHCQRSWQLLERGRRWRRRGAARLSVARTFRYTHAYRRHCARARARHTTERGSARTRAPYARQRTRLPTCIRSGVAYVVAYVVSRRYLNAYLVLAKREPPESVRARAITRFRV